MNTSRIEWTSSTWNPVTGCDKVSAGCANCYAERMARRLQAMGVKKYANGFKVTTHPEALEAPLLWKRPRVIFVNSMGDLFHEDVPFQFIEEVFGVMNRASHHVFQVLTKRSRRLRDLNSRLSWPENVWMGVTVENRRCKSRIDDLRQTGALIRFLSMEPLLEPVDELDLMGIDWVIVGGESGPHARPMKKDWVLEIRRQCLKSNVAFFFKQWGGINKKMSGRVLDGRTWNDMPALPSGPLSPQASLF
jgi:protein gp37